MRVGSLFAGVGGFDLGFERAGMRSVWQVEIDVRCRQVLAARFLEATQYADVREVGAANLAPVDVICGGFPCQDLSIAGRRAGLTGARSGLFYEMARVVNEIRPSWLVWENVPGLFSSARGADFAAILVEMERIGYNGAWTTLNARYFGVAQRRRRVFGVFTCLDFGAERAAEVLALSARLRGNPAPSREAREVVAGTLGGGAPGRGRRDNPDSSGAFGELPDVAWALQERDAKGSDSGTKDGHLIPVLMRQREGKPGGGKGPLMSEGASLSLAAGGNDQTLFAGGVRRLTPTECERLQGFPDGWTEGHADSHRYRMMGNAVAVPCAEWIASRIAAINPPIVC